MRLLATALLFVCFPAFAQQGPITPPSPPPASVLRKLTQPVGSAPQAAASEAKITVPAGTRVFMTLAQPLATKSARVGDPVYLETTVPVLAGNEIAIPAGTFVQGRLSKIVRSGWIHRRVALQMKLTDMIFANGYMVSLPDRVPLEPGNEGNFQESPRSRAGAIITAIALPAAGAGIGAAEGGDEGAAIGGGVGAAAGAILGIAMLRHSGNLTLEKGTRISAVLQHPLKLAVSRVRTVARLLHPPDFALARPPSQLHGQVLSENPASGHD